jgi:hypothetical protein
MNDIGKRISFLETDMRTVHGTIVDVDTENRRYTVEWEDGHRKTEVCMDSNYILSVGMVTNREQEERRCVTQRS